MTTQSVNLTRGKYRGKGDYVPWGGPRWSLNMTNQHPEKKEGKQDWYLTIFDRKTGDHAVVRVVLDEH